MAYSNVLAAVGRSRDAFAEAELAHHFCASRPNQLVDELDVEETARKLTR